MPFIPHTDADVREMLAAIGAPDIEALFDEIPADIRAGRLKFPPALAEMDIARLMEGRAAADGRYINFIGAGAYEHHIPAAVWQLVGRGEFYTAYTPYQAEASQGTLQLLYEYQSMMVSLTGMDVANASLYDGASALAEAVLMAVRSHKNSRRVAAPATLHPDWLRATRALVASQGIELVTLPWDPAGGVIDPASLAAAADCAALVIPQPNFFGRLEAVDALTDAAHAAGMLVIAAVNPLALALLKAPGEWGAAGADIVIGDGQPLGAPLSGGGPYFGFMACREKFVRQMPGRIVGRTVDRDGKTGYTLTLQAREQHIRRSRATSNICTNQSLMVTAATIHMALLGPRGLAKVAAACHANTAALVAALCEIDGVEPVFAGPLFHEAVLRLPAPPAEVLRALRAQGILGGYDLSPDFPRLGNAILVCATELRGAEDIAAYRDHLARILGRRDGTPGCTQLKPGANAKW